MYSVYLVKQIDPKKKGRTPIKIGYSKHPKKRVKTLQTGSHLKLKIIKQLDFETKREAVILERCLHNLGRVKHKAMKGEWFIIFENLDNFVNQGVKMMRGVLPNCNLNKHNPSICEIKAERKVEEELDLILLSQMPPL